MNILKDNLKAYINKEKVLRISLAKYTQDFYREILKPYLKI